LAALASFERLSSLKATHAGVCECRAAGNPGGSGRDDKVEGGDSPWQWWRWMDNWIYQLPL
jgi:hypothetical protein